jgi:hypothetical protein
MKIKVRGIYEINVAPDKKYCGYCQYENDCYCDLFRSNLMQIFDKRLEEKITKRCKKCLKAEIR